MYCHYEKLEFLFLAFCDLMEKIGRLRRLGKPLVGDSVQVAMEGMVSEAKGAIVPQPKVVVHFIEKVEFFEKELANVNGHNQA